MPYRITRESILSVEADAAVLGLEMTMDPAESPVCAQLAAAGGDLLREAIAQLRFLPVGSAAAVDCTALPFGCLILTAMPRWLTGKANELLVLHRCYESVYAAARERGCRSLVTPFLSALYYRFPQDEAVRIALAECRRAGMDTVFVAETPELFTLSGQPYRRPQIVSYIGYYRDHALFALDNGLFARVDLRPERTEVALIPFFEACFREGNNPLQPPLPAAEIDRLREIYEHTDW